MHYPFGNPFVVEVEYLFPEVEVLDQGRSARADFQGVLIVGNRPTLGRGQDSSLARCSLVKLAAFAALELLVVDRCRPAVCAAGFRGLGHWAIPVDGTEAPLIRQRAVRS